MEHPRSIRLARTLRQHDTWAEKLVWSWLRNRRFSGYKFRRQHPFGPYILDFFCEETKVNIELDGSQHGFPRPRFADRQRDAWLQTHGVKVIRLWNSQLRREKQEIRDALWKALQERAPHPLPNYCLPAPHQVAIERPPRSPLLGQTTKAQPTSMRIGSANDGSLSLRERAGVRGRDVLLAPNRQ